MKVVQLLQGAGAVQPPSVIKGRGLELRKMTKTQRALLLRDIVMGTVQLTDLSVRQLAAVVNVSTTYANAAVHLVDSDCVNVQRGLRPLVMPKVPAAPLSPQEQLTKVVAAVGYDAALTMLVANEKAAVAA